ncbi:MAG: hypothetical protein FJ151_03615 [Euryarchaeota archaeon]|nr:hypothetical protein [Euryarchaeota archaeon]
MNEKDLNLMKFILGALSDPAAGGPVLLDVKTTQFVRVNLVLLKALTEEMGLPGMFISVDRPHQYMVHLLKMHQINPDKLTFVDAISRFAADRKEVKATVSFVDGPFRIDLLPNAIRQWESFGNGGPLSNRSCGFAMIDNIATLLTYNSYATVELFLRNFVASMSSRKAMLLPLTIDSERSTLLYETARSICKREVKVGEEVLRTIDLPGPTPMASLEFSREVQGGI